MARSAPVWAVRAQLLTKLRPFLAQGPSAGKAPAELLPELYHHARGLSPADLRLALAAYSHAGVCQRQPKQSTTFDDSISLQQMQDLLVQLLVGGSRLGTAAQLLESAEAIASFAPCDCRPAAEFWPAFAERVLRLVASEKLDAAFMTRVISACSQWKQKCHADVNWGHMIRTVGGHLAEPGRLDAFQLSEVVALARAAAHLEEPQVRLAAAIGHRVGSGPSASKMKERTGDLSSQDLIDLIGAAGKLGGKLHMMTRALADHLEPRTGSLPNKSLVQLCSHLGGLKMFPYRLVAALDVVLPQRMQTLQFSLMERLVLLQAFGRLRWRSPSVLAPLLESLPEDPELGCLTAAALGGILYELYRLDVWDENVAAAVCSRLRTLLFPSCNTQGSRVVIPCKMAANVLLAMSYFALSEKELQKRLLQELLRSERIPQEALYQLKTFEMAIRLGHAAVTLQDLGGLAARWLFSVRSATGAPEPRGESAFADEVSQVARNISWHHQAEVEVGPYLLDFAAVSRSELDEEPQGWDDSKPGRSLARFCVAVEADGPSHFYRPHGSPWHWTSTSKLRHRLLSAMRIRVAHVPFYDWLQLEGLAQKEAYLTELLLRAHSTEFASLSIDTGKEGLSSGPAQSATDKMKSSFVQRRVRTRRRSSELSDGQRSP